MAASQIVLTPDLLDRARERAARLGVSVAEYVQRLVARDLGEGTLQIDPSIVFNLGSSGGADIARDKDQLIYTALEAESSRASSS